jgi:surface carbohydrate biosynthesis protein
VKYLYIPLEIVVRELDGKSLLAYEAALQGWSVIICTKRSFFNNVNRLPPGNVLVKSAVPNELEQLKKIRRAGHKIFLLDEEGVVTYDIFLEGNYRYNEDTIKHVDAFFFWGEKQQQMFSRSFPEYTSIGHNVGSPRLQFWKHIAKKYYDEEVNKIKTNFGSFILFNTSFGIANNYLSGEGLQSSYNDMGRVNDVTLRKFLEDQHDLNYIVYKEYLEFIEQLAQELPNVNIIIRPHPSESERTWREYSKIHKNIFVIYEGSVTPWLLASNVMVHFKSTTSIEANVMDKSVVTYLPELPEYLDKVQLDLPKQASVSAETRREAIDTIKSTLKLDSPLINGDITNNIWINDNDNAARDIINFMEDRALCCDLTLDVKNLNQLDSLKVKLDKIIVKINRITAVKRFLPKRFTRHDDKYIYGARKEKGFETNEVVKRIEFYQNMKNDDETLEISEVVNGMVLLKKCDNNVS